jgi:diacylglycerol kinase (ATP)
MEGSKTRARAICNPTSGGGSYDPDEVRRHLDAYEIEWIETEGPEDAERAAREWDGGLLIVVGGDGTVTQVVNGLGQAGFPEEVTLAVLPTGTGNDLAATLDIPSDPEQAEEVIRQNRVRQLDVARFRARNAPEDQYLINVATGGLGAQTTEVADEEMKGRWGRLAYLRASLEVARDFEVKEATVTLDGEEKEIRAVNVAVGNCRYAGGGWLAAPRANPEDGLLDLVVIEDVGLSEVLSLAPDALSRSDYLDREGVFFARAKEIRIDTEPSGLQFTVDGEVLGDEPAEFSVIPGALRVIVGPDYTPDPQE